MNLFYIPYSTFNILPNALTFIQKNNKMQYMSLESKQSEISIFDENASLSEKYNLTTTHFFQVLKQLEVGRIMSKEDLMRILIGDDYDVLPDGKKNLIWSMSIEPDIDQAIETGKLLKKEDNFEILNKNN